MDRESLIDLHPRLFHMAQAGSWPAIERFGLITTEDLVRSADLPPTEVHTLLRERRAVSTMLDHPLYGQVVIRDQGPLNLSHLERALTDVTVEDWLGMLNSRVFFWLHPDKLAQLLQARRYRQYPQDVIIVDTRSLLDAAGDRVTLSPMNSGATLYPNAPARGSGTFASIADYDYSSRRRAAGPVNAIVELAVVGGVPDLANHVIEVRRITTGQDDVILYP